ncbi:MAG TPA: M48 family metalloprotease [Acidimicrobiales bacterium]
MTTPPERPASSGPAGSSAGPGGDTSGTAGGSRPSGGSRNRRRRGSGGGSGGGSGQTRSGGTGQGGGQSGQGRGGAQGGNRGGGQGGNRGGGGRSGGRSGSGSGSRRPSGQGSNRQGQGRHGQSGTSRERTAAAVAVPAAVRVDRTTELAEEAAASANRRKAILLCIAPAAALGALFGIVVAIVGQPLIGVLVLVVVTVLGATRIWRSAPGRVLAALGATPSVEDDHPRLHNLVDGLCATMGLDRPAICVMASDVPNALALGRDQKSAILVVTSGLEESLGLVELEGVLAHELVHIKRNDTVLSAVAVVVALPWAVVRGTPAGIDTVHHLVGRGREFSADQRAALIVRYPTGIGSALETMVASGPTDTGWPPAAGRVAALTRWLWVDPMAGATPGESPEGNLDDTRVRAQALALG